MNAVRIAGKSGGVFFALLSLECIARGEILFAIFWLMAGIFCAVVVS